MSDPLHAQRKSLFRRIAIDNYERPIELDVPDLLTPWRPGLVLLALALLIAAAAAWIFP
jgi:hypothetical protein